jgi:hypothetical protein
VSSFCNLGQPEIFSSGLENHIIVGIQNKLVATIYPFFFLFLFSFFGEKEEKMTPEQLSLPHV